MRMYVFVKQIMSKQMRIHAYHCWINIVTNSQNVPPIMLFVPIIHVHVTLSSGDNLLTDAYQVSIVTLNRY